MRRKRPPANNAKRKRRAGGRKAKSKRSVGGGAESEAGASESGAGGSDSEGQAPDSEVEDESDDEGSDADAEHMYELDGILDKRVNWETCEHEYLVSWVGYSDGDNTWEPAEGLPDCQEAIEEFDDDLEYGSITRLAEEMEDAKKALKRDKALSRQAVHKEPAAERQDKLSNHGLDAPVRCCECNQVVEKASCTTYRESSKCKDKDACSKRRNAWLGQGRSRRSRN